MLQSKLGFKVVKGNLSNFGLAEVNTDNKVDFPALEKPTKPTSANTLSSRITSISVPGNPVENNVFD
jgi:hypothetical protein